MTTLKTPKIESSAIADSVQRAIETEVSEEWKVFRTGSRRSGSRLAYCAM